MSGTLAYYNYAHMLICAQGNGLDETRLATAPTKAAFVQNISAVFTLDNDSDPRVLFVVARRSLKDCGEAQLV